MSSFVSVLGLTLLAFLWQGIVIGAAAAFALKLNGRHNAQVRYLICIIALLVCAITPCVTAVVLMNDDSSIARPVARIETSLIAVRAVAGSQPFDLISAAVALWLVGVLSIIVYYAVQWRAVERIRRSSTSLFTEQNAAEIARRALGRWRASAAVPVRMAMSLSTPIVIGLWRPMIVFPAAMIARLPAADFELILLHEIAHIVRRDNWVNALQIALEILFFYHPVVHWLSRRARLERERACDDFAIAASGSPYEYARALTSLMIVSGRVPATALGAAGADLLSRLRYLTGQCADHDPLPRSPFLLLLIALLLIGIGAADLPDSWAPVADVRVEPVRLQLPLPAIDTPAPRIAQPEIVATPSAPLARKRKLAPPVELPLARMEPILVQPWSEKRWALPDVPVADSPSNNEPKLIATYSPLPEYPGLARVDGIEGTVSVVVRVAPNGRPMDLQIVHAEPLGVFEGAVRRALMKWRYEVSGAADSSAPLTTSYELRFSIGGVTSAAAPTCVTMTASNTCQPL
jgi:bla regulator protein BlaR1